MENGFLKPSARLQYGDFETHVIEKSVRLNYDFSEQELSVSK